MNNEKRKQALEKLKAMPKFSDSILATRWPVFQIGKRYKFTCACGYSCEFEVGKPSQFIRHVHEARITEEDASHE